MKSLKLTAQLFCASYWFATSMSTAQSAEQSNTALPADTQRILSEIDRKAPKRSGADKRAAASLNREGERAYRKRNYDAARSAFSNSYPNFPTAFAYIMTGDSHWRAVLQFARTKPSSPNEDSAEIQSCALSNKHFPHGLLMDLDQHHEVGLALAAKGNGGTLPTDPFLRRAQAVATCLRSLGMRHAALPPSSCVDLSALDDCLGAPLPLSGDAP